MHRKGPRQARMTMWERHRQDFFLRKKRVTDKNLANDMSLFRMSYELNCPNGALLPARSFGTTCRLSYGQDVFDIPVVAGRAGGGVSIGKYII